MWIDKNGSVTVPSDAFCLATSFKFEQQMSVVYQFHVNKCLSLIICCVFVLLSCSAMMKFVLDDGRADEYRHIGRLKWKFREVECHQNAKVNLKILPIFLWFLCDTILLYYVQWNNNENNCLPVIYVINFKVYTYILIVMILLHCLFLHLHLLYLVCKVFFCFYI